MNAVTPTALRFAPSLLVTDDEIDAAVAHRHKVLARERCRMSARHFLEVDDLTPAEFAEVLDTAAQGKADPSGIPQLLAGQGVALLFEKPSARTRVVDRDGGGQRWAVTRSTSGPKRSAWACASRWPTSPAPWPGSAR